MRNITCSIADTRKRVFAEVAKMAYDEDYSRMEKLPYEILPGEQATERESIFLERAIVGERVGTLRTSLISAVPALAKMPLVNTYT